MQPGNLILECDAHFAESNIQKKILVPIDKTTFMSHNKKQHMCRK